MTDRQEDCTCCLLAPQPSNQNYHPVTYISYDTSYDTSYDSYDSCPSATGNILLLLDQSCHPMS